MASSPPAVAAQALDTTPAQESHPISIPAIVALVILVALSIIGSYCAFRYGLEEASLGQQIVYGYVGATSGIAALTGGAYIYHLIRYPHPANEMELVKTQGLITFTAPLAFFALAKAAFDAFKKS